MFKTDRKIATRIQKIIHYNRSLRWFSLGTPLFFLSLLYRIGVQIRAYCYQKGWLKSHRLACIVISVGNLTVGGTGKTPMTIYLARLCQRIGYRSVIVCRGYKGSASEPGGIVSDGQTVRMTYTDAGDEPLMIARQLQNIPVVIGSNRYRAGCLAISKFAPDVIILDDGFQHLKLARDINLILLDYTHPFGNTLLLPGGPLREPLQALKRADACIFTRCDNQHSPEHDKIRQKINLLRNRRPLFKTVHRPVIRGMVPAGTMLPDGCLAAYHRPVASGKLETEAIAVFGFCGLAHNANFKNTLKPLGFQMAGFSEFPDHYGYTDKDIRTIQTSAVACGAKQMVTTDKDYTRLDSAVIWPVDLIVVGVEIQFAGNASRFDNYIRKRLRALKFEMT